MGSLTTCSRTTSFSLRAPVGDEVADRAELQPVLAAEVLQLRQPGHGAVVVEDLAEDAGGVQAGELGEIDGGLGVAGAAQHAARLCAQRERRGPAGRGRRASRPGSARMRMAAARSAALMPVVTPRAASTETVKSVRWLSRLSATMRWRPSCSARSVVIGAQMRPRPNAWP